MNMDGLRPQLQKWLISAILWLERNVPTRFLFRPCEEVTQMVSRSLDLKPSLRERIVMRLHFLYCRWCVIYAEQLRAVRRLARRLGDPEVAEEDSELKLSPEARSRILKKMSQSPEQS